MSRGLALEIAEGNLESSILDQESANHTSNEHRVSREWWGRHPMSIWIMNIWFVFVNCKSQSNFMSLNIMFISYL